MTINVTYIGIHFKDKNDIWFFDDSKPERKSWGIDLDEKIYIE